MRLKLSGDLIQDVPARFIRALGWDSFMDCYCPSDIRDALQNLPDGEELVLEVNSGGGSVYAASEIYSVLKECTAPTRAIVQSIAASAASFLIMACDKVEMNIPAQLMIHPASSRAEGNRFAMAWAAKMLQSTDEAILATYAAKCGKKTDKDTLQRLMDRKTFITAEQALELGLCDSIIGLEDPEPTTSEPDPEEEDGAGTDRAADDKKARMRAQLMLAKARIRLS